MENNSPTVRFSQAPTQVCSQQSSQAPSEICSQHASQAPSEILSSDSQKADYGDSTGVIQELSAEIASMKEINARLKADNERLSKPCQSKVDGKKFLEEIGYQNVSLADGVKVYTAIANQSVAENKERAVSLAREVMSANNQTNRSSCCHKL